ncbi:MAG: aspartate-semialdehyde dehydrogenase [Armatimonadetes bacterium]|nr:aspartate-semialdehyde dehydrogenase [Armatimonadota bacterium]
MKKYRVAVVGATGAVGSTMMRVLAERQFPVSRLRALATARSAGRELTWNGDAVVVEDVETFDFSEVDIALFAGGEIASEVYGPRARDAGVVVIDNSATFRMDPDVPLVVPEVNPHALEGHRGLIANPNCSTIQMVVALAPLKPAGLKRVLVSTYQSVSGTGLPAIEELEGQVRSWAAGEPFTQPSVYPRRIAFNLLPHIGSFGEDGFTGEERKMILETQKILEMPALRVSATCVRVPVRYSHSESVHVETDRPLSPQQAREWLSRAPGVKVMDEPDRAVYPTALDGEDQDLVLVGRIRKDPSVEHGIQMWVVADNLRKGAASNAIQIAETLIQQGKL